MSGVGSHSPGSNPVCFRLLYGLQVESVFYVFKWLLCKYLHYVLYYACWPRKHQIFTIWNLTEICADFGLHSRQNPDSGFSPLLASTFLHVDSQRSLAFLSAIQLQIPAKTLGSLLSNLDQLPHGLENHQVQAIITPLLMSQSQCSIMKDGTIIIIIRDKGTEGAREQHTQK